MSDVIPLLKFTPSAQDPAILETITVQREPLVAKLVESALDVGSGLRHQLLIGPRGMGKTHILSLVANRVRTDPAADSTVIAWLDEDPWAVRTYEKFIAAIVASVAAELGDDHMAARAAELRAKDDSSGLAGQELLRDALGEKRLLLLAENLDQIFRRIGDDGQARFRAFAEDWRQMLILATSPQIFEGIQLHESPFYGFFAITRLEELSLASAAELMKRVAELRGDLQVLRFLSTETATQRLTAIEALAGGHPRIWLLLSGCVSIAAIEELVPMFLEALDELTPYYQDRLRELGDQQQELIVLLSEDGGALSNRVLAERSGILQNQVASMLRNLTERGYVRRAKVPAELSSGGDSRLSFWELREPLMRLCLDVKQARGKPLRMVVEFLRAWYGPGLLDELVRLPASAQLATTYASEAFRTLGDDLSSYDLFQGSPDEIIARAERGLSLLPESEDLKVAKATGLMVEGRGAEAKTLLSQLIDPDAVSAVDLGRRLQLAIIQQQLDEKVDTKKLFEGLHALQQAQPDIAAPALLAAIAYDFFGSPEESLAAATRALGFEPDDAELHANRGKALALLARHAEAAEAFTRAAELDPADVSYLRRAGVVLSRAGRHEEALAAMTKALELDPGHISAQRLQAAMLARLGDTEEALVAFDKALELSPDDADTHHNKAILLDEMGRYEESLAAFDKALELSPRNPLALTNYGVALGGADRPREALRAFEEAAELDPDNALIQSNYGAGLNNVGRYEDALAAYGRAVELAPDNIYFHNQRGKALRNMSRPEEALETFAKAAELDPGNRETRHGRIATLIELDRLEEALSLCRQDIELNPDDATAQRGFGRLLVRLGHNDEALKAFTRAAELAPGDPLPRFLLAEVILAGGDHERGLTNLREALGLWQEKGEETMPPGDPDSLCAILWQRYRSDPAADELAVAITTAYAEVGAAEELGRGIVNSIPLFMTADVSVSEAGAWVESWKAAAPPGEFGIPLNILAAALAWKQDEDRAHLLALPLEQRDILVTLLTQEEATVGGGD